MTFKAIDDVGHLEVQLELKKQVYKNGGFQLKIEFEVDPTILPRVATELKVLMTEEKAC